MITKRILSVKDTLLKRLSLLTDRIQLPEKYKGGRIEKWSKNVIRLYSTSSKLRVFKWIDRYFFLECQILCHINLQGFKIYFLKVMDSLKLRLKIKAIQS